MITFLVYKHDGANVQETGWIYLWYFIHRQLLQMLWGQYDHANNNNNNALIKLSCIISDNNISIKIIY
jgi:hypothetical protein